MSTVVLDTITGKSTATTNATVAGTLTINSNITLTINDGGRLVVV